MKSHTAIKYYPKTSDSFAMSHLVETHSKQSNKFDTTIAKKKNNGRSIDINDQTNKSQR